MTRTLNPAVHVFSRNVPLFPNVSARFSPALLHRASASAFNKQQHLITRMVNHNVIISTHPSPGRYIQHTYVRFSSIPVEGTYIHRVLADVGVHYLTGETTIQPPGYPDTSRPSSGRGCCGSRELIVLQPQSSFSLRVPPRGSRASLLAHRPAVVVRLTVVALTSAVQKHRAVCTAARKACCVPYAVSGAGCFSCAS